MKTNLTFVDCVCGAHHHVQIDKWEDEIILAMVSSPRSLWDCLKEWWHHRHVYTMDVVLDRPKILQLIEVLKSAAGCRCLCHEQRIGEKYPKGLAHDHQCCDIMEGKLERI